MKRIARLLAPAGCLAAFALPGIAAAQETAVQRVIEEVVVTARYREETVQETPVSVTAFNEIMLERMTAQDLRDVGPATPNVRIQPVVTFPNSAAIHVRGMGNQNIESTNELRAGVSINGVHISRPIATLIDFFDVDNVQILRGPQGTTFGKNSLAGGIALNTKRPDGTVDYAIESTLGKYGRRDLRAAVQVPLVTDKLALRVSGMMQNYDGHFTNRVNNKKLNGEDIDTARATLVWTPTDNVEATLIGQWLKERSDAPGGDDRSDPNQLLRAVFGWVEPRDGAFRVGRDAPAFHNTDQTNLTAIVNWDIGDFTLTSITGYVETDDFIASDFDQSEIPFFPTLRDQVHEQFSQEIRLQSNFAGREGILGRLDFVVGLFYFEQEHELVQSFPTLGVPALGLPSSADYATQDGDSRAIFGQAIYAITDELNLTVGVRRTEEKKDFRRNPGVLFGGAERIFADVPSSRPSIRSMAARPQTVLGSLDSNATTYQLGLDYRFTDSVMGFASFAQGFKAGEFGARASSSFTVGPTDDETADSYEIGIKSDLLGGRLRANATIFHTTFQDLLFEVFIPSDNVTGQETAAQNIGESTHRGFELELTAVPTDGLTLIGSFGFLDAKYDKFCADLNGPQAYPTTPVSPCGGDVVQLPNGQFLVDEDFSNNKLSRAPRRQAYVSAEYEWHTAIGWLFARAATNYESEYFADGVANHPKAKTGDFWLWDAAFGWRSSDEHWRIQTWCKNCGDRVYTAGLVPTANFFNQHFYGWPRTMGVTLAYQR